MSELHGWRRPADLPSLPEVFGTIRAPRGASKFRRFLAYVGPGYLVAVGYMDPGNWATDIAGGATFGYKLLSVILLSNFAAMFLQILAAKLGLVGRRDLAQACRDAYPKPLAMFLWLTAEIGIIACDLAEVLGAAIALNLLFGLPLPLGVALTVLDVFIVLALQGRSFRWVEGIVMGLIALMMGIFITELVLSNPDWAAVGRGFLPTSELLTDHRMLYLGMGILGATVMPHNLYLHSSIVQSRSAEDDSLADRLKFAYLDSTLALILALFVNAAILILSCDAFHRTGHTGVAEIGEAYKLLNPLLGATVAAPLFALALLASGQNSTLTGTIAGQIVMEGFIGWRIPPWARRLISRSLALLPALVVTWLYGEKGSGDLLVLSQVILSLQLPFAIVPLVQFTSDRSKMGEQVNAPWARALGWGIAATIIGLNLYLLLPGHS